MPFRENTNKIWRLTKSFVLILLVTTILMVSASILGNFEDSQASPSPPPPPNDEVFASQPYLTLFPETGSPTAVVRNSTLRAFGYNFCGTGECSQVTLTIGNEFTGNQTVAIVPVESNGTFATSFVVNVTVPWQYIVTASQTAANGSKFNASVPITVPISDEVEEEEGPPIGASSFNTSSPSSTDNITVSPMSDPPVTEFPPNVRWGGRSVAVDVSPSNAAVAIAASESGGLWKTTDSGTTWSHLDGLQPFRMSDVKFAPGNDQVVIITAFADSHTTNSGGIWRSTDGGSTWSKPATADPIPGASCPTLFNAWGISFVPGANDVFVGTDCGVAVSHDLGATWTYVVPSSFSPQVYGIYAQAGGPSGSIVDTCGVDGHHRSTNGGTTWTATSTLPGLGCPFPYAHTIAASPLESGVLFAAVNSQQLYESDDGGVTWTNLNPNQPTCCGRGPWVATHLSSDGDPNHFDIYFSGGSGNNVIRQTCTNTGGPGLRCSTSWNTVSTQHGDPNGLAFSSSSDNCAQYIVTDGGTETTSDCGATWAITGSGVGGYHALQIYEMNGQVHPDHTDLYFGTQDNEMWASGDNGITWPTNVNWEGWFIQMPHNSATHTGETIAYVDAGPALNSKSSEHFASASYGGWIPNPPGGGYNALLEVGNPVIIENGVYIQWAPTPPTWQLYISTDTGASWTAVNGASTPLQPIDQPFVSGPPANPSVYQGVLRPGGNNGLIQITGVRSASPTSPATVNNADSGLTNIGRWLMGQGSFRNPLVFAVDPSNPQHLMAADVGVNMMMVSTTGGTTWNPVNPLTNLVTSAGQFQFSQSTTIPGLATQAHVIAFDPTNGNRILVGTEQAGILGSLDGGVTWGILPGSDAIPAVSSFFFDQVQNDVMASSYGRGLWKLDLAAINRPPVADDQSVTTNQNTPVPITLSAIDPDGDPITYSIVTNPSHGSLNPPLNPSTGTVTYAPIPSYFGPDSFTFKATDNRGADSNTATVSITVKGPPDCNNPTILGSNGNDVIRGTPGNDVINALGGNDVINAGNGGNDEICGGDGNDVINSGGGNDRINGGAERDVINSRAGNDQIYGLEGNDVINSGGGNDLIDGGPDRDIGNAGPGQDTCFNVEIASSCEA
jgi:hypothetical protein